MFILLCFLFLSGYGKDKDLYKVYYQLSGNETTNKTCQNAINYINSYKYIFEQRNNHDYENNFVTIFTGSLGKRAGQALCSGIRGYEDFSLSCTITISDEISEYLSFYVCLHELGHVLGLGHSDNKDDIMYAYSKNRYTQDDIDRFVNQILPRL